MLDKTVGIFFVGMGAQVLIEAINGPLKHAAIAGSIMIVTGLLLLITGGEG